MKSISPRLGVRGLILHENRLLLVNAWPDGLSDLWCAPGGGMHRGARLFSLLRQNPDLVTLVALTLGTAPRLADILARHPEAMDALLEPSFFGALPDEVALAEAVVRLVRAGHPLLGATDHGVNLAVYSRDPDGNGIELMLDRPSDQWPRSTEGAIAMRVDPLNLEALVLDALEGTSPKEDGARPSGLENS